MTLRQSRLQIFFCTPPPPFLTSIGGRWPVIRLSKRSAELSRVVKTPEVVKRLSVETDLVGSTPAEFARHVNTETERWRALLKTIGVTLDE